LAGVSVTLFPEKGEPRTTATDERGHYEFPDLPAGPCTLVARKVGFTAGLQRTRLARADQTVGVYFRLQPWTASPWSVTGTVLREDGKVPLAGATVTLYREQPDGFAGDGEVTTDETGFFSFANLTLGRYRLNVAAPEYLPYRGDVFPLREGADRQTVDLTLVPLRDGRLRGRVLRADGTPAVGVGVQAIVNLPDWPPPVTTDGQGTFVIERVPAGAVWLGLAGEGRVRGRPRFEVQPDTETVVPDLRLAAVGSIEGSVRGLEHVPKETRAMVITWPEVAGADGQPLSPAQAVRLYLPTPGGPMEWEDLPRPARPADGFLFTPTGVVYSVYPPEAYILFTFAENTTQERIKPDGTFRIDRALAGRCGVRMQWEWDNDSVVIHPGVPVTIAEDKTAPGELMVDPGVQPGRPRLDVPGQTPPVELTVEPGGAVAGRVARSGGTAIGRTRVWFHRRETLEIGGYATAHPDGSFAVSGLTPGDYVASVWAPDLAALRQVFTVRTGETTPLELRLSEGVALRGQVEGGRPPNLFVSAESDASFGGARVAEDGSFVFEHLRPGTYTLHLWAAGEARLVETPDVRVGEAGAEGVKLAWGE
jgi:hypothetical protein